ncbi:MAG: sugar transferase [Isosphaeraceae bacterium]
MSIAQPRISPFSDTMAGRSAAMGIYPAIKPAIDLVVASVLLVLTFPIMIAAMMLVRLTSRGPVIYTQRRVGLDGEVFTIFKIRTMYQDSERHGGPTWSAPGDPRVTPVGRFLRLSHLDELPQLFNVLMGEMSLIGPRPERPEFLPRLEAAMPDYRRRLTVRPGVTGLAQVQHPADIDLDCVRRKLDYDLHYVATMGLWLDLRIVIATGLKCAGVPFGWIRTLLLLPQPGMDSERAYSRFDAGPAPKPPLGGGESPSVCI